MRYDNDGPLLSTAYGEALIEDGERGVLCPHSGVGELGQERPEGAIALPRFARALLARTFILPWCHTGPCGQARGGLKARHIDPDLRHDHFRATLIDPRNGVQKFDSTGKGERRRDRARRGTVHGEQRWWCFPGRLSHTESLQRGLNGRVERLDLFIEN